MNEGRGGLLTAGGILSIITGVLKVIGGGIMMVLVISTNMLLRLEILPFLKDVWIEHIIAVVPIWLSIGGGILLGLGIIAIIGGISAIRRKNFGLALAGAICTLPSGILGILAIIFVALGKREFQAES
ncbi:MAG TPA: hypothetical protein ENN57_05010 [Chloroflexi bacterium]|nr:hypothetical protein [Chloroflexota bacterium]